MGKYIGYERPSESREISNEVFTASAGQTTFSANYSPGYVEVYINGVRLFNTEFTATDGSSVTLSTACIGGEEVSIKGQITSAPYDYYTKANIDSKVPLFGTAAGTVDALTVVYSTTIASLVHGQSYYVKPAGANTSFTPTLSINGIAPRIIVKGYNLPLSAGDLAGSGYWAEFKYDSVINRFVLQNPLTGVDHCPPGFLGYFATPNAPAGWLKANGAEVSRTTYARLFAQIGTVGGVGNGTTTFNVPDLRGEFIRGLDDGRGIDTGRGLGTWQKGSLIGFDVPTSSTQDGVWGIGTTNNNLSVSAGIIGVDSYLTSDFSGALLVGSSLATSSSLPGAISQGNSGMSRPRNVAWLPCIRY